MTATTGVGRGAGPVRQASLREHNLGLVLRQVANALAPISRAAVAAATGLTRATVSSLVEELIAGRLLLETEPSPRSGAGRPAVGLALAPDGVAGLGLEVNVDYLAACVVDLTGAVRHSAVLPGDRRGRPPGETLRALADLAADAVATSTAPIAGATLAVPGLVRPDGLVRTAPNLGWRGVDVRADLCIRGLDLAPAGLAVDNEANLAALGELHAGAASSFLYVSGEVGIGAGIVLDGRLFRGARGFSGEIGHVAVRPDGPPCRCGAHGCLEQYAGQEAILRAAGLVPGRPGEAAGRLAVAAERGNPAVLAALAEAGRALGVVLAGVVNVIDVPTVVLGGLYVPLATWLSPAVRSEVDTRVLTADWESVEVVPARLGVRAAAVGAAGSVVRAVRDDPARWLARG
ncbi:ROK family transcriptional regulator [Rhizomonospora bruguierae]|uniref:ROK family transcriptional regulator n=1 Tax=Rhizomonospora bruguierae TaxID=1581705 RepID=UPI001BCB2DD2|nr:ROK family protein [Micromonospora sp. NBRC 107566]